jgi:hypothetical protein
MEVHVIQFHVNAVIHVITGLTNILPGFDGFISDFCAN